MDPSYPRNAVRTKHVFAEGFDAGSREKLVLVIPTLREVRNIRTLLAQVVAALTMLPIEFEVLVVDDDSGDGIEAEVAAIASAEPRVKFLVRTGQRGLAGAVLHGWCHTDATILATMDADMQHPPALLPRLVQAVLEGCDLVIGSRYARGNAPESWHLGRKFISRAAIWATRPLQGMRMSVCDPMSGYFVVRRHCVEGIAFQSCGFKLLLEILVRGRVGKVEEIPFAFGRRAAGRSKAGMCVAMGYGLLLVRLYGARMAAGQRMHEAAGD